MASDLRTVLIDWLEAEAPARGLDVVDVEVAGARKAPLVRIYLDNAGEGAEPIDLEELSRASRWVSNLLDERASEAPGLDGPYTLEVSSPGLERPLRREADFARFLGRRASVRMAGYEGRRNYTGTIDAVEEGTVTLTVDGEPFELPIDSMARAHLELDPDDL